MKPVINYYLIISFLSLFFISSLNAQTSNLLTIGNMESAGWNIKNLDSDAVLSYENNGSHDGTKAMKIVAKNIGQNSYYVIIGQGQQLNLKENEHYTISYWAKSPDAAGIEITPWIQISDATINYPFTNLESGRLSNEWQKFSYTFNYSLVSSNKALFKFRVWSPGTIYLDNVQIGPADESDINNNTIDDEPIYSVLIVYKGEEINQTVYKSNCPIYTAFPRCRA